MDAEKIIEVVQELIGDIQPCGDSHIDEKRFENLKVMCAVVVNLITEIDTVVRNNKDKREFSMKTIIGYANNFLKDIKKQL